MAYDYRTSDGKVFSDNDVVETHLTAKGRADRHQAELDGRGGSSSSSSSRASSLFNGYG